MDVTESPILPKHSNLVGPAPNFFGGYNIGKSRFYADPSVHGFNTGLSGEQGLLVAVVWRAIRDLESDDFVLAMDARRFFLTTEPTVPFSFDWIMIHFSRTAMEVREILRSKKLI